MKPKRFMPVFGLALCCTLLGGETPGQERSVTDPAGANGSGVLDGEMVVRRMIEASRYWLLPSLQARRGLVYDYTQEPPYRERVWFDPEGRAPAQLESNKESPGSVAERTAPT